MFHRVHQWNNLVLDFLKIFLNLPPSTSTPDLQMLPSSLKNWISQDGTSPPMHSRYTWYGPWLHYGTNSGPSTCKAKVLTTTLWTQPLLEIFDYRFISLLGVRLFELSISSWFLVDCFYEFVHFIYVIQSIDLSTSFLFMAE